MLRRLNRSSVFFTIALFALYLLWNPGGYSVTDVWAEGLWPVPIRVLLTLVLLVTIGAMAVAAWRSLGPIGLAIMALLIAVLFWAGYSIGLVGSRFAGQAGWIWQPILAFLLTFGLRWPRFRQRVSGVMTTHPDDAPNA